MRMLLAFLILGYGTTYAQQAANSPLTTNEGRQILGQLYELRTARAEIHALEENIARDKEQDAREKQIAEKALDLQRQGTELEKQRTALATEKAALYEQMYRSIAKGPGVGCRIARALTAGIYRCN
jgi:hypothetical protein